MDALSARALLFQRKLTIVPVPFSIPGVPELDNQLSIIELGEDQIQHCTKLAEQADGTINSAIAGAAGVCKSLVMTDTKERLFSDNDAEAVATWAHSVLAPLNEMVTLVSHLTKDALEDAKKNYPLTVAKDSGTSSQENSGEALPSQS